jgi:hypothetical protein
MGLSAKTRIAARILRCCSDEGKPMELFRNDRHRAHAAIATMLIACAVSTARADDKVRRILWRDPGPISAKDLSWGDKLEGAPQPPFKFVAEDTSGTKPKVDVIDAAGTTWGVKFTSATSTGIEVHAEIAASRLMWALGYLVEESYYLPEGQITGVPRLRRAGDAIAPDGTFRVARFEKRPANVTRVGHWDLQNNPFVGSRELSGLKILMMLISNWDLKSSNTAILRGPSVGGGGEEWFIISDLGTAFGRSGGLLKKPTRWNLDHYGDEHFIRRVVRGTVEFTGVLPDMQHVEVPVQHARWFAGLISQLRPDQLRQAFEAAGASPAEVDGFSAHVTTRIKELQAAVSDED